MNEAIRVEQVRVIGPEGEQLGVMSIRQALATAQKHGLDLIERAPKAEPPVCKIEDWDRVRFQSKKKKGAGGKKQHKASLKVMQFRPVTGEQDIETKSRKIKGFLDQGDKVRIVVRFRGREMMHVELGQALLERIASDLSDCSQVDQMLRVEGRQASMVLAPVKKA